MLHTFPSFLHVTPDHLRRDVWNSRKYLTRSREARTHSRISFASTFNTGITNKPSRDYKRSFLAWWWSSRLNWKTRKDERRKGSQTHTQRQAKLWETIVWIAKLWHEFRTPFFQSRCRESISVTLLLLLLLLLHNSPWKEEVQATQTKLISAAAQH